MVSFGKLERNTQLCVNDRTHFRAHLLNFFFKWPSLSNKEMCQISATKSISRIYFESPQNICLNHSEGGGRGKINLCHIKQLLYPAILCWYFQFVVIHLWTNLLTYFNVTLLLSQDPPPLSQVKSTQACRDMTSTMLITMIH